MQAAAETDPKKPADIEALRKIGPPDLVPAALALVEARRKAAGKFSYAERILADPEGVEQATSEDVADYKARRFADAGEPCVVDLCCGIGGDGVSLGRVAAVELVDRDPERWYMARHNLQAFAGGEDRGAVRDATAYPAAGCLYHIDPSRRRGGRRAWTFADYEPGPAYLHKLAAEAKGGAMKLGPGVDLDALPPGEVELISRRGELVQAVLWTGSLAGDARRATRIDPGGAVHTLSAAQAAEDFPPDAELDAWLFEPDPAVERAGLLGPLCEQIGCAEIHPGLGLLTAGMALAHPFLAAFEVLHAAPFATGGGQKRAVKKIGEALRAHGAGVVEVKTRGGVADAAKLQKAWRGDGAATLTIFVVRLGKQVQAIVTRRA